MTLELLSGQRPFERPKIIEVQICQTWTGEWMLQLAHTTVWSSSLHEVSLFVKDGDTMVELDHPLSSNTLSHSLCATYYRNKQHQLSHLCEENPPQ
jgi:hypothetical protein